MASIVFLGSFLAGSLLTLLIPIGLLIALAIWHTNSIRNIPGDPSKTAPHAAGPAEADVRSDGADATARTTQP